MEKENEVDILVIKVKKAKDAVKDLEEPLKTKAFEIILNNLLKEPENKNQNIGVAHHIIKIPDFVEDAADKLINEIDRTKYTDVYKYHRTLEKSLFVLDLARQYGIDGLAPSQISKILSNKFRITARPEAVSMALMNAGQYVDRIRSQIPGKGTTYLYRIMHNGEKYLTDYQCVKTVPIKNIKSKTINSIYRKPKSGLKDKIIKLIGQGYFNTPKLPKQVADKLRDDGHPYIVDVVRTTMFRLVKEGRMKRIREQVGSDTLYKYQNFMVTRDKESAQ